MLVWLLFDLKTRNSRLFYDEAGALEHRDIIIAKSRRARSNTEGGGIAPRTESEYYITQVENDIGD